MPRELTAKGRAARDRIVEGAAEVLRARGAAAVKSLAAGIRALQSGRLLPAEVDVEGHAAALLAGIQGGVTILLATGRSTHLRAALDQGIAALRGEAGGGAG